MSIRAARASAAVQAVSATTYDGFYLRDNLAAEGQVPALSPYNQSPDLIQSAAPLADAQSVLSTQASWNRAYRTEPMAGTNYYYARGLNGAPSSAFAGELCLFYTPAELILFPSLWKHNPLRTASGAESVSVSAEPGHIGVGEAPWLLAWPTAAAQASASTFTSFIVQNTASQIPTISSWEQMSQLMTQQLSFGWRNQVTFDPTADEGMLRACMGLTIPGTVGEAGTVQLILTSEGFVGDTIALLGDRYTPEKKAIQLSPTKITSDGQSLGIQVSLDPGFVANLTLQYWNTSGSVPAPGSTITLTANYLIPTDNLEQAMAAGIIDSRYSRYVADQLNISPQAVAPLGMVTLMASSGG